MFFQKP